MAANSRDSLAKHGRTPSLRLLTPECSFGPEYADLNDNRGPVMRFLPGPGQAECGRIRIWRAYGCPVLASVRPGRGWDRTGSNDRGCVSRSLVAIVQPQDARG